MESAIYIGVDLGRSTRIAAVDSSGAILTQMRVPTQLTDGRALADGLIKVILEMKQAAPRPPLAVGIGLPGLVEHRSQQVQVLPNFPDISNIDLHRELVTATGLPVILDNDAAAAAYGEWQCGAARGAQDAAYIMLGTGIGGALILGGRMQRGAHGFAGEFGHIKIGSDNLECSCGSVGCLETVASGPNIVRRVRERLFDDPSYGLTPLAAQMTGRLTCEDVVEAGLKGDDLARSVLTETARYLGTAIANVVNLLNVEKVVLGGPVMAAGELLLTGIREEAAMRSFAPLMAGCKIVVGNLGGDAGVIGAGLMAREAITSTPARA